MTFVALCSSLANVLNIWQDEAYSMHTASNGLASALRQGVSFEAQAPLYFGVLAIWNAAGDSVLHARLLSILFSLITLCLTRRAALRYIDGVPTNLVVAAVAFNPFMIWAAIEIRPYAAAIALSAAMLYLFLLGWIDIPPNRRARIAFVVATIIAAYTQYYVAALFPATAVALRLGRRHVPLGNYLVTGVVIAAAIMPIALFLPTQLEAGQSVGAVSPALPAYTIVRSLLEYVYPHGWIGSWTHRPWSNVLYFILVAIPAALAAGQVTRLTDTARVLATTVTALCAIFALLIAVAHVHVLVRHSAVLFVPAILSVFAMLGSVSKARKVLVLASFMTIYSAFSLSTLWNTYHAFAKNGDWARVGNYLNEHAARNDTIAVFDAEAELPLSYYTRRLHVQAIPQAMSFKRFDERSFVLHGEDDVAKSLKPDMSSSHHVWLVLNDLCATHPIFYGCDHLNAYIAHHFHIVRLLTFEGSSITELLPSKYR